MQICEKETWVDRLSARGELQDQALEELRQVLSQRLTMAFRTDGRVDDSFIEDVVQDSLLMILEKLHQFENRSRFTTWATTIAVRVAYTELRRLRWKDISLDRFVEESGGMDAWLEIDNDPARHSQTRQMVETLYDIIQNQLSDRQRTALLAELKGMPQEEIGRRLGSSRNAVYKLTHDARKRVRKGLLAAGYHQTDLDQFGQIQP